MRYIYISSEVRVVVRDDGSRVVKVKTYRPYRLPQGQTRYRALAAQFGVRGGKAARRCVIAARRAAQEARP